MRLIIFHILIILVLVSPNLGRSRLNQSEANNSLYSRTANPAITKQSGLGDQAGIALAKEQIAPEDQTGASRWYVYLDADSTENHGEWTNWMPEAAGQMLRLDLVSKTEPASGSTCIRIDVAFQQPPGWCGIAVASQPDYWGITPGAGFELKKARTLIFSARGEKGGENIQIKTAIAGDKKYGDSARIPAATSWIALTRSWKQYELSLRGYDLSRVITPFVFVTDVPHNEEPKISFYLDDIYFAMGDGK